LGSNPNAESGSEGAAQVGDEVYVGDAIEKLWASSPDEVGLPEGYLDTGVLSTSQDLLAATGDVLGVLEGQRSRCDTHPNVEWTGVFSFLGEANRINGCPVDLTRIEEFPDFSTQREPHLFDWVFTNGTRLPRYSRPGVAGAEDADGVGGEAFKVRESPRVPRNDALILGGWRWRESGRYRVQSGLLAQLKKTLVGVLH
jgi:hypothetical protein